jgi:quercetin dioxygenase-like cupin family protein
MNVQTTIERKKLLKVPLREWTATDVDVRSLEFAPGQRTGAHFHPCPVVGYIVEGAAILQIDGQVEQRLEKGSAFHEPAGVRIARFDNASKEKPLHLAAMYLMKGEQPLIEMLE